MANTKLLLKTLQYVKDHPEEHDQTEWFELTRCGTTACFAGTALVLSGYRPYWEGARWTARAVPVDAEYPSAENVPVHSTARDLLGLTVDESDDLFFEGNTVEDLERIVNEIIAGDEAETGGRDDG